MPGYSLKAMAIMCVLAVMGMPRLDSAQIELSTCISKSPRKLILLRRSHVASSR
ncbi:MAG: hypothetical protein QW688_09420 [Thermoprotei archaeon]